LHDQRAASGPPFVVWAGGWRAQRASDQEFQSAVDAVAKLIDGIGVLAITVAVRTFLSFTLDVELPGRRSWQERRRAAEASGG
jgi:hypothetical protein